MPRAGIEPARYCYRGIFIPTTVFTAQTNYYVVNPVWGLDYVFISERWLVYSLYTFIYENIS